jgi:glycerophosphoryl diester phosphodiesterase
VDAAAFAMGASAAPARQAENSNMSPTVSRCLVLVAGLCFWALDASMSLAQQVIAHRGASYDAPENTLVAFRLAWQQGADGIEGDFYLTADGEIVCLHDADTGRTGDRKLSVGESTLAELRTVDVGIGRGERFRGERIPTLAEVLALVPSGKRIFVEIKSGPQIMSALKRDLLRSRLKPEQITIISFHPSVIEAARKQLPDIRAYWLCSMPPDREGQHTPFDVAPVLESLQACGASGLGLQAERGRLTKDMVAQLHAGNYELNCWTVDDADLAREYQALGFDSITTNRPALLRNVLGARGASAALPGRSEADD